ncbi:4Fe-4S binding protein, partial [bacterium]|nr:4Fe-4S binding protein [bacterium]
GIEIICLAALTQILVRGGWAKGVEFVKMRLSRPDESGRRRQVPKKGSNFWLKVDGVVSAIEELADIEFLPDDIKSESQGILVERGCFTSRKGVFAGGDVATGRATVAHAIGSGNKAALAIERYLKGEDFFSIPESLGTDQILPRKADSGVVRFNDLNPVYFKKELPVPLRARPVKTRVKGFKEVYSGYKAEEIVTEAQRCFSCGVCNMCDNCLIFCPRIAISRRRGKFGYKIDVTSCDGCGICVQECPRDALSFRKVP